MMDLLIKANKKFFKGHQMKADLPTFIIAPLQWIALVLVLAVLVLAWQQTTPILATTANAFGLPVSGTAVAGIKGLNQSTYLNIGNQLYNFDPYLALVFFFIMIAAALSTLFLNPNPLAWYIGILFSPFLFWISSYTSNFAYQMFTQPALANAVPFITLSIFIMSQLPAIVFLFFCVYLVGISIRVYFYNPAQSNQRNAEAAAFAEASRRRGM